MSFTGIVKYTKGTPYYFWLSKGNFLKSKKKLKLKGRRFEYF